jgi:hypothetical protein
MDEATFVRRFAELDSADHAGIAALGAAAAEDARHAARILVPMLNDSPPEIARKALLVLSRLEELAAVPLLEAPPMSDAGNQVWGMRTVVETTLSQRQELVDWLRELLDDKEPISQSPDGNAPRVCDHAYLLIGKVLGFTRATAWHQAHAEAFLRLPSEERDKKIEQAKGARIWPLD